MAAVGGHVDDVMISLGVTSDPFNSVAGCLPLTNASLVTHFPGKCFLVL